PGQEPPLEVLAAVPDQRLEPEDPDVDGAAPAHTGAGGGDLLLDDGRLGDAHPAAAVLLRDGQSEPATLHHGLVELPRERLSLVAFAPVLVGEAGAHLPYRRPDVVVQLVGPEPHGLLLASGPHRRALL